MAAPRHAHLTNRHSISDLIYDLAVAAGVDSSTVVVDVGCATGDRGRELIRRTGCQIEGIELLPQLIEWGQAATAEAGMADSMRFRQERSVSRFTRGSPGPAARRNSASTLFRVLCGFAPNDR